MDLTRPIRDSEPLLPVYNDRHSSLVSPAHHQKQATSTITVVEQQEVTSKDNHQRRCRSSTVTTIACVSATASIASPAAHSQQPPYQQHQPRDATAPSDGERDDQNSYSTPSNASTPSTQHMHSFFSPRPENAVTRMAAPLLALPASVSGLSWLQGRFWAAPMTQRSPLRDEEQGLEMVENPVHSTTANDSVEGMHRRVPSHREHKCASAVEDVSPFTAADCSCRFCSGKDGSDGDGKDGRERGARRQRARQSGGLPDGGPAIEARNEGGSWLDHFMPRFH